jgi:hypothetical protein
MATRYSPDTCSCTLEYEGDADSCIVSGKFTVINKCEVHKKVDDKDLLDVVLNKENRVKNGFHAQMEEIPDLVEVRNVTASAPVGEKIKIGELPKAPETRQEVKFKDSIGFSYYFEGEGKDRVFHAITVGVENKHKETLQSAMDEKHGEGKVIVE